MSKVTGVLIFAAGAAVGSAVTWYYAKKYFEQRNQEEIESVKKTFSEKKPVVVTHVEKTETNSEPRIAKVISKREENPDIMQYAKILDEEKYSSTDRSPKSETAPYVISPDEFGEFEDYDTVSLTYFSDGVLADENDDRITDVEHVVGAESLTHFGEYEDDSVFVRDDRLRCDYEILMDERTYSDVLKQKPHRRED